MTKLGDTKWDKQESTKKPLGDGDKQTMVEYYEAGLKTGKGSEDLLTELAERYGRSPRQISRYVSEARESRKPYQETPLAEVRGLLQAEVRGLLQEVRSELAQAEAYDHNHVALSRKRALAELICKELADVAPNGIYSLTAIQARLLKSTPEQRMECLRESLGGLDLTPAEEETLVGALTDSGLAEKFRKNAEAIYRRIKRLERHHYPLTTSDVMLISTAAETDDDQFNEVLKVAWYNEEPDCNADVISAATKLLLDVGEQVVLLDEVEKDTRRGSTKKATTSTAQERVELAKRLAASWFPRLIRALARTLANETEPATGWIKAEQ
jgi:hypothetical protein